MLGTLPGAEEPEQDLEGKQAQRGDRSTRSLEGSAPGPPRDAGALQPDMTWAASTAPLHPGKDHGSLAPPPLPGEPPASRSSTPDIPSGRWKTLSPPYYTEGLAINALSAGHRTA